MNKKLFAILVALLLLVLTGCAVRERISIDTRDDSYIYGGADLFFYSDDHSTQKLRIVGETGAVNATGALSVTNWALFYGVALQPQLAQVVTASYGITPGNYSVLNLADDGGQATGTIALDTTVSIVSGTHVGQILLVFWLDADGVTLTIQDNGNMQGPSNADVVLGYQDSAMFFWDGTDWLCINVTDL